MASHVSTESTALSKRAFQAAEWLLNSGVQVVSDNPQHSQGFACWYEQDTQTMPYVYSEITGYLTTLMCYLYQETGDSRFLDSATGAGDWLVRTAYQPDGGFRCLFPLVPSRYEFKHSQLYTFDTGVILSGLVNLYRATQRPLILAAAVTTADWLIRDMQKPDGTFYAVYDVDQRTMIESDKEWSLCSGSYHTKVAIGLANLYDATRHDKYLQAAVKACDIALTFQQPDGRFISFPTEGGTNSHPHAYSAEGLWTVGKYLGREDYLSASVRATEWLLRWQSPEGYVPRHFHDGQPLYNERVDVLGQTLRLASIHIGEGRIALTEETRAKLDKLVTVILRNQAESDDRRVNGAFYFGRLSSGELMPHANVWVSAFAIQGLRLYDSVLQGQYRFDPFFMV